MALTLKADNRSLLTNAVFTYLANNYSAATIDFVVSNTNSLATNDYLLFGEFGSETSEVLQISTITTATKTIRTGAATFAHPESTKITVIPYNQVRFYYSTSSTDTAPSALSGYLNIEADDFYTKYKDTTNTTGYGFFIFYNATTLKASAYSNPIPYAGFDANTVSAVLDAFFSLMNNKEQKLISIDDAMRWMNEAYSMARNALGLASSTYTVPASTTISIVSGTAEYSLPSDFSSLVSITDSSGNVIEKMELKDVAAFRDNNNTGSDPYYFFRGTKIGFVPTPTSSATYTLYYKSKAALLDSLDDTIDFPNNEFYFLVDFMMYRAAPKLTRPNPENFFKTFQERINIMKITSHKQDNNPDSWDISSTANV